MRSQFGDTYATHARQTAAAGALSPGCLSLVGAVTVVYYEPRPFTPGTRQKSFSSPYTYTNGSSLPMMTGKYSETVG